MSTLAEMRRLIAAHATPDFRTPVDGLLLSRVTSSEPHYSLSEPLLVVLVAGGKHLQLGDRSFAYGPGQCLIVTAELPFTGHFEATPAEPALGLGLALRPADIAPLLLHHPAGGAGTDEAVATGDASPELLDACLRLLRLLDRPHDVPVLGPLIQREILWRLLTGPHGDVVRRIGLADGTLAHVNRAIAWIRANYAEPLRVDDAARVAGLSRSAFDRHFRAVTAMSPLQFQKHLRLQEARSLLIGRAGDVAGVGHLVGYDSPSQFSREYRRLFGRTPGQDAARLRSAVAVRGLP